MRFIDNRHIRVPDGWEEQARQALDDVCNGRCSVNDRSQIWRDLKDDLARLSHDKCWYCEAKQERSDDAVDHFRPKGRVNEANGHPGYWWLAFDKSNYRYSCTFCNSRRKNPTTGNTQGKGDHFPITDENARAQKIGEEDNEECLLIDPCKAFEPDLIDFHADGTPCPRFPDTPLWKKKAEKSIYYYSLDHPEVKEARRLLAVDLESWIKEADQAFAKIAAGNNSFEETFQGRVRDIKSAMKAEARYSSFARRVVADHKNLIWIEMVLQSN